MKWFTDRQDLGLVDGVVIFLCTLYFLKKAFIDKIALQRIDLAALVLAFLYIVSVLIHYIRTSRQVLDDNLELVV